MTKNHKIIEFSRNWWSYSLHLIIALGIFALLILITGLHGSLIFFCLLIVSFIILISLVGLGLYIRISGERLVNSLKNQQFPSNLDSASQDYDGFIVNHSLGIFNSISYPGFDILIQFFVSKKYPFKIYHCYNSEDFKSILKNEKARYIWIFGHGWRGGVTFKWTRKLSHLLTQNRTRFSYKQIQDDLENYPRKIFIGQFHCNHIEKTIPDNISLPEILLDPSNDSTYYVPDWKMNTISIWIAVRKIVKDVRRTEVLVTVAEDDQNAGGCSII